MAKSRICKIEGCGKGGPISRGWCAMHYRRWYIHGDPHKCGTRPGEPMAFLLKAAAKPLSQECVLWPFAQNGCGYGQIYVDGRGRPAHRVAYEVFHGETVEAHLVVAHEPIRCHNRACINPAHLRVATHSSNSHDRFQDGTHARGERCTNAKLTSVQALEIFKAKGRRGVIASRYGVSEATVTDIRRGKSWGWLTGAG